MSEPKPSTNHTFHRNTQNAQLQNTLTEQVIVLRKHKLDTMALIVHVSIYLHAFYIVTFEIEAKATQKLDINIYNCWLIINVNFSDRQKRIFCFALPSSYTQVQILTEYWIFRTANIQRQFSNTIFCCH